MVQICNPTLKGTYNPSICIEFVSNFSYLTTINRVRSVLHPKIWFWIGYICTYIKYTGTHTHQILKELSFILNEWKINSITILILVSEVTIYGRRFGRIITSCSCTYSIRFSFDIAHWGQDGNIFLYTCIICKS